jgi:hypothetical protein
VEFVPKGQGLYDIEVDGVIVGGFSLIMPGEHDSERLFERIMSEDTSGNAWAVNQGFGVYEM